MGWHIRLLFLTIFVLQQWCFSHGKKFDFFDNNPFANPDTAEEFTRSFVKHVTQTHLFGNQTVHDIEGIVESLVMAMKDSSQGHTESQAKIKAMTMAFASSIAELVVSEDSQELDIQEKTDLITKALEDAFKDTTGKVNKEFIHHVKILVELFELESSEETDEMPVTEMGRMGPGMHVSEMMPFGGQETMMNVQQFMGKKSANTIPEKPHTQDSGDMMLRAPAPSADKKEKDSEPSEFDTQDLSKEMQMLLDLLKMQPGDELHGFPHQMDGQNIEFEMEPIMPGSYPHSMSKPRHPGEHPMMLVIKESSPMELSENKGMFAHEAPSSKTMSMDLSPNEMEKIMLEKMSSKSPDDTNPQKTHSDRNSNANIGKGVKSTKKHSPGSGKKLAAPAPTQSGSKNAPKDQPKHQSMIENKEEPDESGMIFFPGQNYIPVDNGKMPPGEFEMYFPYQSNMPQKDYPMMEGLLPGEQAPGIVPGNENSAPKGMTETPESSPDQLLGAPAPSSSRVSTSKPKSYKHKKTHKHKKPLTTPKSSQDEQPMGQKFNGEMPKSNHPIKSEIKPYLEEYKIPIDSGESPQQKYPGEFDMLYFPSQGNMPNDFTLMEGHIPDRQAPEFIPEKNNHQNISQKDITENSESPSDNLVGAPAPSSVNTSTIKPKINKKQKSRKQKMPHSNPEGTQDEQPFGQTIDQDKAQTTHPPESGMPHLVGKHIMPVGDSEIPQSNYPGELDMLYFPHQHKIPESDFPKPEKSVHVKQAPDTENVSSEGMMETSRSPSHQLLRGPAPWSSDASTSKPDVEMLSNARPSQPDGSGKMLQSNYPSDTEKFQNSNNNPIDSSKTPQTHYPGEIEMLYYPYQHNMPYTTYMIMEGQVPDKQSTEIAPSDKNSTPKEMTDTFDSPSNQLLAAPAPSSSNTSTSKPKRNKQKKSHAYKKHQTTPKATQHEQPLGPIFNGEMPKLTNPSESEMPFIPGEYNIPVIGRDAPYLHNPNELDMVYYPYQNSMPYNDVPMMAGAIPDNPAPEFVPEENKSTHKDMMNDSGSPSNELLAAPAPSSSDNSTPKPESDLPSSGSSPQIVGSAQMPQSNYPSDSNMQYFPDQNNIPVNYDEMPQSFQPGELDMLYYPHQYNMPYEYMMMDEPVPDKPSPEIVPGKKSSTPEDMTDTPDAPSNQLLAAPAPSSSNIPTSKPKQKKHKKSHVHKKHPTTPKENHHEQPWGPTFSTEIPLSRNPSELEMPPFRAEYNIPVDGRDIPQTHNPSEFEMVYYPYQYNIPSSDVPMMAGPNSDNPALDFAPGDRTSNFEDMTDATKSPSNEFLAAPAPSSSDTSPKPHAKPSSGSLTQPVDTGKMPQSNYPSDTYMQYLPVENNIPFDSGKIPQSYYPGEFDMIYFPSQNNMPNNEHNVIEEPLSPHSEPRNVSDYKKSTPEDKTESSTSPSEQLLGAPAPSSSDTSIPKPKTKRHKPLHKHKKAQTTPKETQYKQTLGPTFIREVPQSSNPSEPEMIVFNGENNPVVGKEMAPSYYPGELDMLDFPYQHNMPDNDYQIMKGPDPGKPAPGFIGENAFNENSTPISMAKTSESPKNDLLAAPAPSNVDSSTPKHESGMSSSGSSPELVGSRQKPQSSYPDNSDMPYLPYKNNIPVHSAKMPQSQNPAEIEMFHNPYRYNMPDKDYPMIEVPNPGNPAPGFIGDYEYAEISTPKDKNKNSKSPSSDLLAAPAPSSSKISTPKPDADMPGSGRLTQQLEKNGQMPQSKYPSISEIPYSGSQHNSPVSNGKIPQSHHPGEIDMLYYPDKYNMPHNEYMIMEVPVPHKPSSEFAPGDERSTPDNKTNTSYAPSNDLLAAPAPDSSTPQPDDNMPGSGRLSQHPEKKEQMPQSKYPSVSEIPYSGSQHNSPISNSKIPQSHHPGEIDMLYYPAQYNRPHNEYMIMEGPVPHKPSSEFAPGDERSTPEDKTNTSDAPSNDLLAAPAPDSSTPQPDDNMPSSGRLSQHPEKKEQMPQFKYPSVSEIPLSGSQHNSPVSNGKIPQSHHPGEIDMLYYPAQYNMPHNEYMIMEGPVPHKPSSELAPGHERSSPDDETNTSHSPSNELLAAPAPDSSTPQPADDMTSNGSPSGQLAFEQMPQSDYPNETKMPYFLGQYNIPDKSYKMPQPYHPGEPGEVEMFYYPYQPDMPHKGYPMTEEEISDAPGTYQDYDSLDGTSEMSPEDITETSESPSNDLLVAPAPSSSDTSTTIPEDDMPSLHSSSQPIDYEQMPQSDYPADSEMFFFPGQYNMPFNNGKMPQPYPPGGIDMFYNPYNHNMPYNGYMVMEGHVPVKPPPGEAKPISNMRQILIQELNSDDTSPEFKQFGMMFLRILNSVDEVEDDGSPCCRMKTFLLEALFATIQYLGHVSAKH